MRFAMRRPRPPGQGPEAPAVVARLGARSIVLVGLMGCGKSSIGRRLADYLGLPFVDADAEIELSANKTIPEIFADHGEAYFRNGEQRVIARLLGQGPQVLATGGGAWMNPETRARVADRGVSVWLKAELPILMRRVMKRANRPLLKTADPYATMQRLMTERYPVYAEADLTIESRDVPHGVIVEEVVAALLANPRLALAAAAAAPADAATANATATAAAVVPAAAPASIGEAP